MYPRLIWNSQSSCLSLPSAGIADANHYTSLRTVFPSCMSLNSNSDRYNSSPVLVPKHTFSSASPCQSQSSHLPSLRPHLLGKTTTQSLPSLSLSIWTHSILDPMSLISLLCWWLQTLLLHLSVPPRSPRSPLQPSSLSLLTPTGVRPHLLSLPPCHALSGFKVEDHRTWVQPTPGSAEEAGGCECSPLPQHTHLCPLCLSLCPLCRPAPGYFWQDCGELGSGEGAWRRTISCQETPPSLGPGAGRTPYLSTLSGQPAVGLGGTSAMACPHPHSGPQPESARPPACSSRLPR
jgi:hypothetical protein